MCDASSFEPPREVRRRARDPLVPRPETPVVLHHAFSEPATHGEVGDAGDRETERGDAPLGAERGELGRREVRSLA